MTQDAIKPFKIIRNNNKNKTLVLWIPAMKTGIVKIVTQMFHDMHCNVGILGRRDELVAQNSELLTEYIDELYKIIKEQQEKFSNIYTFSSSIGSTISLLLAEKINKNINEFSNFRGGIYSSPIIDIKKARNNQKIIDIILRETGIDISNKILNSHCDILSKVSYSLKNIKTPALYLLGDIDPFQDLNVFKTYIEKMNNAILLPQKDTGHWDCYITDEKQRLREFLCQNNLYQNNL